MNMHEPYPIYFSSTASTFTFVTTCSMPPPFTVTIAYSETEPVDTLGADSPDAVQEWADCVWKPVRK